MNLSIEGITQFKNTEQHINIQAFFIKKLLDITKAQSEEIIKANESPKIELKDESTGNIVNQKV